MNRQRNRREITFGVLLLAGILFCTSGAFRAHAQVAGATLSGTVTDPSGATMPHAQISISNVATRISTLVSTNSDGFYSAPNLLPGNYEVTVVAKGFSTTKLSAISLAVGAQQLLNVTMKIGETNQTIEVTGAAPNVQLTSSTISAQVDATTVRELPLNGRSWTGLAALQPGVTAIQEQHDFTAGSERGNRGFGAQVSISGARPQQNNYRLDGVSLNDYANGAPGSVTGGNLGVDAIQEFSVLTSNYSAEYGKTSGGVVNAITRSGTNQFHGAIYEFLRNSALDARNFFDRGKIPPFKRNQFGGSAGGPIRKDRTFIFGDYEGIRESKGISITDTVPSAAARAGNLSTGKVTVDPSAAKFLGIWPLPNLGLLPSGDAGIFSFAGQQVVNENFLTSRVDHKISEKDSLFGTYMYDDTDYQSPDGLNAVLLGEHTKRHMAILEETHIFSPTLINTVRVGYNRVGALNLHSLSAINPLAADPSFGAIPGRNAPNLFVGSGITPLATGGLGGAGGYQFYWNSFQGYDDAFVTRGAHSLKFGVNVERIDLNMIALVNPNGQFNFGSFAAFLTNSPSKFSLGFPDTHPLGVRQTAFGAYVQDDWRARPNLTLNLGLRYEMTTVPTEVHGRLSTLINPTDPKAHLGDPFFLNPTLRNCSPRVGFAWDPFRNEKTAVRGGFGLFDVLPLPYQFNQLQLVTQPNFLQGAVSKLPQGSFPAGAFQLIGLSSFKQTYVEHAPKRSYVMQWNFNVQQQLTPSLTATVGYVGSHGVHLPFRVDAIDYVIPTLTASGYLFPSPVGSGTILNPNFGSIRGVFYESSSSYNSLQAEIRKKMSHGLQAQGSFTWGKSIDPNSSSVSGDQWPNSIKTLYWFDTKASRAVSDYNIGRTLVLNVTWQVPGVKSASGLVGWVANGWQLGAIYIASDGVPFTPTFGTDGDPLGSKGDTVIDFPNRLTGPGCESLVNPGNPQHYIKTQCFTVPTAPSAAFYSANCDPKFGTFPQCFNLLGNAGRNILTGPGLSNLDFSVFKNNPIRRISENFNVQFRAEVFNILNRVNFLPPVNPNNTDIFDSSGRPLTDTAGLLTSTGGHTAREIQFALKFTW